MKKVLFVLAITALTACGSATAPEATADTTVRQDSLGDLHATDTTKSINTTKEIK